MVNVFNQGIGMQVPFTDNSIGRVVPFSAVGAREFLPQISPDDMEKIKKELHGMIGRRITLTNDELDQIRRAINMLLEDPNAVLRNAMATHRLVAVLSSEPACGAPVISALREGGATHLAMNLPKIFQPALDHYQATSNKAVLSEMLKHRGFKHPLSMLETAVMCGIKLVAVGDQQMYVGDRRAASIESIAIDVSNILDQSPRNRVILWASDHYVRRNHEPKVCLSSTDYLALNHKIFTVHNGNYLVDGGPLRKIVFDLQCPGALTTGRNRLIDGLSTGVEDSVYRDWDAILLQPRPLKDHSYFLTND